ncbi:alternate-type signal peptide domain-containing protein [Mycetocola zhadangensis]|uniref:alternate-type signal peptide domain-containing protein n=1 Tax=Mycetocola zhadangensis TaxID=1164595 RepID=UPI003A4D32BF
MKKSARTLVGASIAAVIGSALLLGGAGTLAFWSDTASVASQQIQSGTLDLGTSSSITITAPSIKQCTPTCTAQTPSSAYTGAPLVPGDVVTATMNVPVTLSGQNMKATFTVAPSKTPVSVTTANTALSNALSVKVVTVGNKTPATDDAGNASLTLTPAALNGAATIPVVVEIAFPWGSTGQYNDTMGGQVKLAAAYTLTQVAG